MPKDIGRIVIGMGMIVGLLAIRPGIVHGQKISYSGFMQYSTGSYFFSERTGSFYLSNQLTWRKDILSTSLSIPFVIQDTPWISYSPQGPLPSGGPSHGSVGEEIHGHGRGGQRGVIDPGDPDTLDYVHGSFTDPSFSVGLLLYRSESGRTFVNSSGSVKFPLSKPELGFGTGNWDFSGGVSLAHRFYDSKAFVNLSVFYWFLGDMEDLELKNSLQFSGAIGRLFDNGRLLLMGSFLGSTPVLYGVDPPLSSSLGLLYRFSEKVSMNGNLVLGLTKYAPDFSIGLGWDVHL